MIYNENGIIIDTSEKYFSFLHKSTSLDSLEESFSFKDLKKGAAYLWGALMNKLADIIDFFERLPYHNKIMKIKKNQSSILKILEAISDVNDYEKTFKGTISKYINASGYGHWYDNFESAINDLKRDPSLNKDKVLNKLYYVSGVYSKDKFFNIYYDPVMNASKIFYNSKDIINSAISVKSDIQKMRRIYNSLKSFNFAQNKDEKISTEIITILNTYLTQAIRSYKELQCACIELCIRALNLFNKYGNDMESIKNELISYDIDYNKIEERIYNDPSYITKIKNPSNETLCKAVKTNIECINYIKNPSDDVIITALNQNILYANKIKNPSVNVALYLAHMGRAYLLQNKDLSEEVQLALVDYDPHIAFYFKDTSEKVLKVAFDSDLGKRILDDYFKHGCWRIEGVIGHTNVVMNNNVESKVLKLYPKYSEPSVIEKPKSGYRGDFDDIDFDAIKKKNPKLYNTIQNIERLKNDLES